MNSGEGASPSDPAPIGVIGRLQVKNTQVGAAEIIRGAILDGRFPPGARLKEKELAEMLGISRTPVREAFLLLAAQGLVEVIPGRGVTVRGYNPDEMECNYDMRARLESYAVGRAASRIDRLHLDAAHATVAEMSALDANDVAGLVASNARFHTLFLTVANDDRLAFMVRNLLELPLTYKAYYWSTGSNGKARSIEDHIRIIEAVETGDVAASELAMADHITHAGKVLMSAYSARAAASGGVDDESLAK